MRYVLSSEKPKVLMICANVSSCGELRENAGKLTEGKKSLKDWALMREKCMPQNIHVKGSMTAILRPSQVPPTSSCLPPFDKITRYCAISLSSGVSHLHFSQYYVTGPRYECRMFDAYLVFSG